MANEAIPPNEVLDGEILSDAHLTLRPKRRNSQFKIALAGANHVDRLLVVKHSLWELGVPTSPQYPKITPRGRYVEALLVSRQHPQLTLMRLRWYKVYSGGEYHKTVPPDLVLTPISIAHWFMGDGCSKADKRPGYGKAITCYFSTESYDIGSIVFLERLLHDLEIKTGRIHKKPEPVFGASIRITILQESIDHFMDMITPYVAPSYVYKIKKRGGDNNGG